MFIKIKHSCKKTVFNTEMETIIPRLDNPSKYIDRVTRRTHNSNYLAESKKLQETRTVYVGNLSFQTTTPQIHFLFSTCGEIERVVLGLDRFKKTPCGFCFVIYKERQSALNSILYINGTKLGERIIRVDLDAGFIPGREFGRGKSGGQIRDEEKPDETRR